MLSTANEQQTLNAFRSINKMFSRARNNSAISFSIDSMIYMRVCCGCECECVYMRMCAIEAFIIYFGCAVYPPKNRKRFVIDVRHSIEDLYLKRQK